MKHFPASRRSVPTLLIGGTHSGVGKTSVALGLMRAFSRRGLRVQPFKVGPDFIDPGHHTLATGRRSHNLDGWMIPATVNQKIVWDATEDADLAIIEGVMGLFDGYGMGEMGSTAELAKLLGASVLLVIDAQGMGRSAAAILQGFQQFDPAVNFLGAILNRVGSDRHRNWVKKACEVQTQYQSQRQSPGKIMPILGGLPRQGKLAIPRRHLGLVLGGENESDPGDGNRLDKLGDWVECHLNLDLLHQKATPLQQSSTPKFFSIPVNNTIKKAPVNIGIARDRAFCFHYEYNLELLRKLGANLIEFSPLKDSHLPHNLQGIYIAGGYPELHGKALSENKTLRQEIANASKRGMPIYAECGGLIYLSQSVEIRDGDGYKTYPMVGAMPFSTAMGDRSTLGYCEVRWAGDSSFLPAGAIARGHCFHYSQVRTEQVRTKQVKTEQIKTEIDSQSDTFSGQEPRKIYQIHTSQGEIKPEGYLLRNTLASYVHMHWGSCPEWVENWLDLCRSHCPSHQHSHCI
ncbi:MAG: cobyrinate a,c-diamide synthase [Cyanobacteria bacterium P01_C01_bin.89]